MKWAQYRQSEMGFTLQSNPVDAIRMLPILKPRERRLKLSEYKLLMNYAAIKPRLHEL